MTPDPWDVAIYRPYAGESPWPHDDDTLVRVAKIDDVMVGAYWLRAVTATVFELTEVCVAHEHRDAGLGRWLVGHALGLAESRGAREVLVDTGEADAFFERIGFKATGAGRLRFEMTPE